MAFGVGGIRCHIDAEVEFCIVLVEEPLGLGAGLSLVGFVMEINLRGNPQISSKINEGKREELMR